MKKKKNKINIEMGSGNVFEDLGFKNPELMLAVSALRYVLEKFETSEHVDTPNPLGGSLPSIAEIELFRCISDLVFEYSKFKDFDLMTVEGYLDECWERCAIARKNDPGNEHLCGIL
jgi:hypothetical protein